MVLPMSRAEKIANAQKMAIVLRVVHDELYRTVDEHGNILHMNRINEIYNVLRDVFGDDYWKQYPVNEDAPKIVLRHISGD